MLYFKEPGKQNTEETVKAVLENAEKNNINTIVVASGEGYTAKQFLNCGKKVIVVTHQAGYKCRAGQEFPEDLRKELTEAGMTVLTTTHFLAGADRALNFKFGGMYPAELIAHTLRILGQGFKVCTEISVMAMDAGLIGPDEDIIAVGGSAHGADTAVLLRPAHSQYFFETNVKEIICMPRGHNTER